jgi:hypothetical protein
MSEWDDERVRKMASVVNGATEVFYTGKGRHFHLFDDCRGLWQGRNNSVKADRSLWAEDHLTYDGAVENGLYGCTICHKRVGVPVPPDADLRTAMARNAARRAARKAEHEAAAVSPTIVEEMDVVETPGASTTVDELKVMIEALMAKMDLLVAA